MLYVGANEFYAQLHAVPGDGSYDNGCFASPEVLVVDDLGLRALVQDRPTDLYEIVRRRYEQGSKIITSNRALVDWHPLFGNQLLASAAMDRLLHHAHLVTIDEDSYRNRPSSRKHRSVSVH